MARVDFQHPHRTLLPAAGSGQGGVDEAQGESFSGGGVRSTPPTTIMTAPNSGCGPTCCGTSTTRHSTPMLRHWPGGPTPSTGFTTGPKPSLIPRPSGGAPPGPWNETAGPRPALPARPVGNPGQAVPTHRAPHQRTLRLRGRTGGAGAVTALIAGRRGRMPSDNNAAERSLRHLVIAARSAAAPARSRAPRAR